MLNKSAVNRIKETVRRDGPWVLLFAVVLIPMVLLALIRNPDDQKRLNTLNQMAAETPVHPLFIKLDSTNIVKSNRAVLSLFYKSVASYGEVRAFYVKELVAKGWSQPKGDRFNRLLDGEGAELAFQKGEYYISVEYESAAAQGWNFAINYGWERP